MEQDNYREHRRQDRREISLQAESRTYSLLGCAIADPKTPESEIKENQLSQAQASLLSNLQVELEVELGKVKLTMEDLLDLSPGRLLDYVLEDAPTVSLRLAGTRLARGRLVKREDKVFVEISELV